MPQAPASPEESNIANDLKAYEDSQVEVEGAAKEGGPMPVEEDWFEEPEEEGALCSLGRVRLRARMHRS